MTYILENVVQILVATAAGLAFGFIWYRTVSFGQEAAPLTARHAVISVISEFWLACILAGALILAPPEAGEWVMATGTPIVIWVGFIVPALVVTLRRLSATPGTIMRELGHWLGVMLLQALVLQSIGLTAPTPA